ncbi:glycoside hydrolase family 28 protein [Agrobacterium sp. rho-13.3]|uniref:polygalacturonase PglA n=1 Tax=Agrobacterium sp. rho-13.3 TaxID=3072980 RepID=UPI002A108C89|nr:glycoside hydrolase family 28 protein [Agrobacterium sp. rho-13.3]MDX8307569.1 glycoside hydrolase family 28 protein [Agrobacterium sp. rho-13.3]
MTNTAVQLVTASSRTATFSVDAHKHFYALDQRLSWSVTKPDGGAVVVRGHASSVAFTVSGLEPDQIYDVSIGDTVFTFSTKVESALIDIRDFGASPVLEDNAQAIAQAIAAVPVGGTLRIPAGLWNTGPLYLKSHMTLLVEQGAELSSQSDWTGLHIFPAWHEDGRVLGTWEGVAEPTFASIINAIDCEGLTITGAGIIDGGGDRGDWWTWPKESRRGARRPRTLFLSGCRDLTLSGFTVRNSPSWTVHPVLCDHVLAVDLRIENEPNSPNTDGFNPECCQDVRLIGLFISVGDDCIAIKAGKRHSLGGPNRPTERIDIVNCLMERGHGAVVMGSEMSAGVYDINISHCHFVGTDRGLRIKTRRGRGGEVANIHVVECRMDNVATPIAVNAFYFCDADGRSDYVQSRTPLPVTAETPSLSGFTLRNVEVVGAGTAAAVFYGLPEAPIRDVVIENYHVTFNPDAEPEIAEMASDLPALRHAGIVAENTHFKTLSGLFPASIDPTKNDRANAEQLL